MSDCSKNSSAKYKSTKEDFKKREEFYKNIKPKIKSDGVYKLTDKGFKKI